MGPAVIFTTLCDDGGQCSKGRFLWLLQFAIARCDTEWEKEGRKYEKSRILFWSFWRFRAIPRPRPYTS